MLFLINPFYTNIRNSRGVLFSLFFDEQLSIEHRRKNRRRIGSIRPSWLWIYYLNLSTWIRSPLKFYFYSQDLSSPKNVFCKIGNYYIHTVRHWAISNRLLHDKWLYYWTIHLSNRQFCLFSFRYIYVIDRPDYEYPAGRCFSFFFFQRPIENRRSSERATVNRRNRCTNRTKRSDRHWVRSARCRTSGAPIALPLWMDGFPSVAPRRRKDG